MVLPFIYAYTSGSRLFRFVIYPVLYVVPWVMVLVQRDRDSVKLVQMCSPFTGLVFVLIAMQNIRNLLRRRNTSWKVQLIHLSLLSGLAVIAAVTPMVPFAP